MPSVFAIDKVKFTPELTENRKKAIAETGFSTYVKVHYRVNPEARKTWATYGDDVFTLLSDSPAGSIYDARR